MQGFSTLRPRTGTGSWPVQTRAACRRRALAVREPLCVTAGHSLLSGRPCLRLRVQPPVRTSGNQTQGAASCENGGASDSERGLMWGQRGLRLRVQPPVRTVGPQTQGAASCEGGGASDSGLCLLWGWRGLRLRAWPPVRTRGFRLRARPPVRTAVLRLKGAPTPLQAAHEGSLEPSWNHPHPQAAEKWSTTEPVHGATEVGNRCINAFLITC